MGVVVDIGSGAGEVEEDIADHHGSEGFRAGIVTGKEIYYSDRKKRNAEPLHADIRTGYNRTCHAIGQEDHHEAKNPGQECGDDKEEVAFHRRADL